VLQDDVGDLVGDVAVMRPRVVQRIGHDDDASAGEPECGAGEGVVLQVLQFLEPGAVDEFVGGADLDAEVLGDGDGSYRFGGAEPHVGADA
jgi:hypothetical protein